MIKTVKALQCSCERCGHVWQRKDLTEPKVCLSCKSPYWNKKKTRFFKKAGEKK